MGTFSWEVGGLKILRRAPSHVGADYCLEHLGSAPCGLFPSVGKAGFLLWQSQVNVSTG